MGVEFVDKDTDLFNSKSITDSLFITQQLQVRYGHRLITYGANKWKQKVKTCAITDRAQWNYKLYSDARAPHVQFIDLYSVHVYCSVYTVHGAEHATMCHVIVNAAADLIQNFILNGRLYQPLFCPNSCFFLPKAQKLRCDVGLKFVEQWRALAVRGFQLFALKMYRNLRIQLLELAGIGKYSVGLANTLPAQFQFVLYFDELFLFFRFCSCIYVDYQQHLARRMLDSRSAIRMQVLLVVKDYVDYQMYYYNNKLFQM